MAKITHWWSLQSSYHLLKQRWFQISLSQTFCFLYFFLYLLHLFVLLFCGGEVCILMLGLGYTISRLHNGNSLQRLAQLHGLVWFVHWNESHFCYSMGLKRLPMSRPTAQPNWGQLTPERWGNSRISNP